MGGSLIVISGPSGVGKGTVVKRLLAEMPDLYISVSVTTRKPRPGEIPGKDYIFIDDKQFEEMVVNNQLLEWAYVHGHYYGTPKRQVFDKLAEGKTVILEIDMQGAMQVQRSVDDVVLIFLLPPSIKELANRLDKRGTEDEEIRKLRVLRSLQELDYIVDYDFMVLNEDLDVAVQSIKNIINMSKWVVTRGRARYLINKLKNGGVIDYEDFDFNKFKEGER
ncbi:guanylate kinase [bacterium 3DAC]|jgi:guanylate kinase|nr:guanylate kinase [Dictyoglomota bacterium]UZN23148.1 guanylate kinase [bacterium 3DAC]